MGESIETRDPIAYLERRIDEARRLPVAGRRSGSPDEEVSDDPMRALRERIERARRAPRESVFDETLPVPLASLAALIEGARRSAGEPAAAHEAFAERRADPRESLARAIAAEVEAIGGRRAVGSPVERTGAVVEAGAPPSRLAGPSSVERRLGGEVLDLLRARPLPGPARAELAERLGAALEGRVDEQALREMLAIVVLGSSHDG